MEKVGVVVVTYNRISLLQEVICSIQKQTYLNYDLIIVNNGSDDGTYEWLNSQKGLYVINQENVGGAGGFFTGIKYVAEHKYDYCWIMDDDVICSPDALNELINAVSVTENVGFVCSKVVGIDGSPMNTPKVDERPCKNGYPDAFEYIQHQMVKIQTATFVSVLFPTKIIEIKGLPYKEYFIWGDDTEYTTRISRDFNCYMACKSIVIHKRVVQRPIFLENEVDIHRIKLFRYKLRNQAYNELKYNGECKTHIIKKYVIQMFRYLIHGNSVCARIYFQATCDFMHFSPIIEFPEEIEK